MRMFENGKRTDCDPEVIVIKTRGRDADAKRAHCERSFYDKRTQSAVSVRPYWREGERTAPALAVVLAIGSGWYARNETAFGRALDRICDEVEERAQSFEDALSIYDRHWRDLERRGRIDVSAKLERFRVNLETLDRRPLGVTGRMLARLGLQ